MDFDEKNKKDWVNILSEIFPTGVPNSSEWTDLPTIVKMLKTIGSIDNSNHMFYPTGGGLDIEDANLSVETGCIEIDTGGLIDIVKPKRLIFNSFNAEPQWSYFRLETFELLPSGVYGKNENSEEFSDEEVTELERGHYISRTYWDQGVYQGMKLPSTARVVTRHFRGSFVIFQKTSTYNRTISTYDGRHNKMSDTQFRDHIQKSIDSLKKAD